MKLTPDFPHSYLHIHIVGLIKLNRALLNYSLEAACCSPGDRYTHSALETVKSQLTIREVVKTITILQSVELPAQSWTVTYL